MGVQGLTSLLEAHPRIYRDVRLRTSRLVIDGCNLLYLMYFSSGVDQNHGGDYAAFEDQIEKFVAALRLCEITPYVVLDGGSDTTDKKLETSLQRAAQKIRRAHQAAATNGEQGILPPLAKIVFKQTLARLQVPLAQCYGEADQEIAALAKEWNCPVLSNDSDFYIFSLQEELLPINHFSWEAVEQSGSRRHIPCKSYRTSSFCIVFDIQPQLLPAFAALAGNDYVKLNRMESSVDWAQFAGGETPNRLEGLLRWLRGFRGPQEALEAALGLMGDLSTEKKAEVLKSLSKGMKEYELPPSTLKRFFIHGTAPLLPAGEQVAGPVPDWMRLPLTQARLNGDILDVLQLRRVNLAICVDHRDTPSANLTSRPLRQATYGLLLGGGTPLQVEERDRESCHLKFTAVPPAFRGVTEQLVLNSLNEVELSERLQVLLEALKVTEASLRDLPPKLRLPVAVTCYWLRTAQPPPDETLLKALLVGLSNGDTLRQRAALQEKSQCYKPKLDLAVVHAFNQWQACLKDSIHLNQLLDCPLPEPQVARLYEGTLVHQLVRRMKTGARLKAFLKSNRSSVKQYHTMMSVVHQFHTQEAPAPAPSEPREEAPAPRQPMDDLTTSVQQLFLQCNDEETVAEVNSAMKAQHDLHLGDLVSVRTRYRTKERNNRCNHPELSRKQECRGWDLL